MYDWTIWQDHVTTPANRFTITDNGDGSFTVVPVGEVMQQGTPQDQVRFNNIERGIIDAHAAIALLMNFARQNSWEIETGTIALTNSQPFPFNNSIKTVSTKRKVESTLYIVLTEVLSAVGNPGEIVITDKLANGFKIAYTGSAKSVEVKYTVIGGTLK